MDETDERAQESEQEVDRIFDLVCPLPADKRAQRLDELDLDADVRSHVEQMLAIFDEPRQGIEDLVSPVDLGQAGGRPLDRLGVFEIERSLGEGGMGVVYLARRHGETRPIALKVMRSQFVDDHSRNRFRREAEVLARLAHPGICRFLDAGDGEGPEAPLPYIAMEYVDGTPLHDHARLAGLDDRERVELMARVCDALHYAHGQGVIHRDLKPNNILVAARGAGSDRIGQPKVLDFGVARARGDDLITLTQTDTGALIGTVAYMSPEQVGGPSRELDARSDVYSLGVLLFELLSGRLPYPISGQPIPVVARMIQYDEPTKLGSVLGRLSGALEHVVSKALEKEPHRRYPSAAALAEDLRHFARGEAVSARASSWTHQARKFARRHRVLTAALLGTFAALMLGLATTTWFAVGQARARREADARAAEADRNAYGMAMRAAFVGFQMGDTVVARNSLDTIAPSRRGWEWRHLDAAIDESLVRVSLGDDFDGTYRTGLEFSRSGERLTVWEQGKTATIELASGLVVERHDVDGLTRGPTAGVGARLSAGGALSLLAPDGREVSELEVPAGARRVVTTMLSPPGVLVEYENGLLFVDTASGVRRFFETEDIRQEQTLGPTRSWLAMSTGSGFDLWNVDDASAAPFRYRTNSWRGKPVAFSPVGDRMALPDAEGRVSQWRLAPGRDPVLEYRFDYHERTVNVVTYSQDGELRASAGASGLVVSATVTGERLRSLVGPSHGAFALRFSADAKRLASFTFHGELAVWDLAGEDPRVLRTGASYAYAARFDPSGERFYAGTPTGALVVYDAESSREIARVGLSTSEDPSDFHVNGIVIDKTRDRVLVTSQFGQLQARDRVTGALQREYTLDGALSVDVSPDGSRLAVASGGGTVRVLDDTWEVSVLRELSPELYCVRYTPSGRLLVVGAGSDVVHVLDAETLETRMELGVDPAGSSVRAVAFAERSRWMAAPGEDQIRVWDLDTFALIASIDLPGFSTCLTFSPDETRLAIGSYDSLIVLVETGSWNVLAVMSGHTDYVYAIDFSPDGETLLTTGGDGTVRLWGTRPLREIYAARESYDQTARRLESLLVRRPADSSETLAERVREGEYRSARDRELALQLLLGQLHSAAPRPASELPK